MTDPAPASAPAPAPGSPGASDLLAAQMSPEAARETIKGLTTSKEFYAKLKAECPVARQYWRDLHKAGFPAPEGDAASIVAQTVRREAEQRESFLGHIADLANL